MNNHKRYGFFATFGIAIIAGLILAIACFAFFTYLEGSDTAPRYEENARKDSLGRPTYTQIKEETQFDGKPVAAATMIGFSIGFIGIFLINYVPFIERWINKVTGVKPENP